MAFRQIDAATTAADYGRPVCYVRDMFGNVLSRLESWSVEVVNGVRQHVFVGITDRAGTPNSWQIVRHHLVNDQTVTFHSDGNEFDGGRVNAGMRIHIRVNDPDNLIA